MKILNSEREKLIRIFITFDNTIKAMPNTMLACILPGRQWNMLPIE
jgi:hypothetical protein